MNISQKKLLLVLQSLVKEFIEQVQSGKTDFKSPVEYSEFVLNKKIEYSARLKGIELLVLSDKKLYYFVQDSKESLTNQACLAYSQFNNDYFANLKHQAIPATSKTVSYIPFDSLSFNPEQELEELGGSFEFDVLKAESLIQGGSSYE